MKTTKTEFKTLIYRTGVHYSHEDYLNVAEDRKALVEELIEHLTTDGSFTIKREWITKVEAGVRPNGWITCTITFDPKCEWWYSQTDSVNEKWILHTVYGKDGAIHQDWWLRIY